MPHPQSDQAILLARIQRLWHELQALEQRTPRYEALEAEIRRDADAFRTTDEGPRASVRGAA